MRAVGVPCGILDQAASILGRAGSAVLLDCGTLEHRLVRVPAHEQAGVVVAKDQRPRRVGIENVGQAVAQHSPQRAIHEQHLEVPALIEQPPRARVAEDVGVEPPILDRSALVDVDERQPRAIGPEAPQQIAGVVVLVEEGTMEIVRGDVIAGADRIDLELLLDAERNIRAQAFERPEAE